MRTKDQTLETDQSFLCNRSVIISFENRSEISFAKYTNKRFGFEIQNNRVLSALPVLSVLSPAQITAAVSMRQGQFGSDRIGKWEWLEHL